MRFERNLAVVGFVGLISLGACAGERLVLPDLDDTSDASCTKTKCGEECVDTKTDPRNCGTCGMQCPGTPCNNGMCAPAGACPPGLPDACGMGPNRVCTNLKTDPMRCGNCMTSCGMGKVCNDGTCGIACGPLQVTCGTGASATCRTPTGPLDCCGTNCPLDNDCTPNGCVLCTPTVVTVSGTKYTPPAADLKVSCTDANENPTSTCPAVKCGSLTFFVYSDVNNATELGIVGYDSNGGVAKPPVRRAGTRYIKSITVNANQTVTLRGQDSPPGTPATVTMTFADFQL
jgi:hypothetical protein